MRELDPQITRQKHRRRTRPPALDLMRRDKRTIFLDSGAYSTSTQGVEVDLQAYARFIKRNHDIIEVAASLDIIDVGQEQQNYSAALIASEVLSSRTMKSVLIALCALVLASSARADFVSTGFSFSDGRHPSRVYQERFVAPSGLANGGCGLHRRHDMARTRVSVEALG